MLFGEGGGAERAGLAEREWGEGGGRDGEGWRRAERGGGGWRGRGAYGHQAKLSWQDSSFNEFIFYLLYLESNPFTKYFSIPGANQKSSSHFHCLKCDYYCTDTNKVVAHRRQHQKLDSIMAAGFEKYTPTQACQTQTVAFFIFKSPSGRPF